MLVFDDADFAAAEVTDQLNSEENVSPVGVATATSLSVDTSTNLSSSLNSPSTFTIDTLTNLPLSSNSGSSVTSDTFAKLPAETPTLLYEINQSHENIACSSTNTRQVRNTSFGNQFSKHRVTVQDISPLPKKISTGNAGGRRRKTSGAIIQTESPHKKRLKEVNNSAVLVPPKTVATFTKQKRKNLEKSVNKTFVWECLVCGDSADEDWIQCAACKQWAHEECAGIRDDKYYYCDNCADN